MIKIYFATELTENSEFLILLFLVPRPSLLAPFFIAR
jgi:hypothetical protein